MSPQKKRRRHRLWPWFLLFFGLPALSVGLWYWATSNPKGKKNPKSGTTQRPNKAKKKGENGVLATGEVRPQVGAEVKVGTRLSGRVETVIAAIGNHVKKGDILATLEKEELEAAVKKAKAASSAAWAKLSLVRKGARSEEIDSAKAALDAAHSVMKDAARELKRRRSLYGKKLISKEQMDHAQRDFEVAKSKWQTAKNSLELKKKLYRPEEVAYARHKAMEAKATLEMAQIQLSYATIRAPIDGVVATVSIQNGETVSTGLKSPTLVTIIDLKRLQVEAYVDEVDIGRVGVDQKATFTVDTFPNKVFKGTVQAIYPKAVLEDNVVNYLTIISYSSPKTSLRPGMTANVSIATGSTKKTGAHP